MGITERIDAITFIPPEYRTPCPPIPKSVKIELTARCDFKCFYCASGARLRKKSDMDQGFFKRIAQEMRTAGVSELGMFYLGESFLCDWLEEAIHYAKHECGFPYVFLTTNGRLATPERLSGVIEAGLDSLKFSLNYANPAQFREVTQLREKDFATVIDHIKAAKSIRDEIAKRTGRHCGIYASSIHYDAEQQDLMEETVREILPYVDEHYWLPLYGQAGLTAGAHGKKHTAGNQGRLGALRPPLPCWALFTEGHITYDGFLSACCFDHDGRFHMGDLKTTPFQAAWTSDKFQALRQANLAQQVSGTVCEKCIAY